MGKAPILNRAAFFTVIEQIHIECYALCKHSLGTYLENAGNIGIFCQTQQEYEFLLQLRDELVVASSEADRKYFELLKPIVINSFTGVPSATYTHLYIRKPDPSPYGQHRGDIDFIMPDKEYGELKESLMQGKRIAGASLYEHPTQDMIELSDPDVDSLAYVSTRKMSHAVRFKM